MADGRIIIDTEIDNSGAEGGIKTLNAKLGSLAKTGLATFTGAIVAAGSAIGGLAGIATKYNSQMEDYFANFTVLLGSTTEATKHVEALKKFAAKTPFEMAGLANASKQLLSFGIGIDDIMSDLQMLGDISLGNQERFKGLALVFAQVASAGKLTGQDLLQFINQGFNPLQVIAEQTGKSMSDLKEEMSDGKITYEMVAEAMRVATSEGGKFYQGMEVQSQTLSGMWSTLKDDTMSLIGEAFTPFSEILKTNVMPALQEVVEQMSAAFADPNIQTSISNIASGLGDFITKVAELVSEWLPKVIEGFAWLLDHSNEITAGIIGLGTALMVLNVANMIMGLVKAFQAFKLANEGATIAQWLLNAAMSANPIGIVVALIAGLVAAVIYLWNTNEGFRNAVIKIFSAIMSTISWVVNGIVNFFTSTIPNAIKSALNWFSNLGSNMHSIGSNIVSGIWNGITGAAGWLMNKIKGFASSVVSSIKNFFKIKSPSRLMRDLIGVNLVKGIGVGIDVETPNLQKDIDANMSDLIAKMQGTVDYETSVTTAKVVAHNNTLGGGTDEGKDKTQKQVVENHIHVDIEGREVAHAIAPHQDILNEYQEGR
ncbi:tape measure protein [uncultured Clostridium sp.]|uniref:tape measure protein n=1 Tax=uncultured Clostridium sp. TaxID=59620 RepID=UPI00280C1F5E|nr:tape measure protein [uncultured Clostridium sp.]